MNKLKEIIHKVRCIIDEYVTRDLLITVFIIWIIFSGLNIMAILIGGVFS